MAVVFATPAGFQDRVDFQIDAPNQRINYRSRSRFGLYDFGKNRSRMEAFANAFRAGSGGSGSRRSLSHGSSGVPQAFRA